MLQNLKTKSFVAGLAAIAMTLSLVGTVAQAQTTTTTTTTTTSSTFTRNLTVGSSGADVASLQAILVSGGYLVIPAGVAPGYFGSLTKAAVARWQAAVGISPAVGFFGPISRARIGGSVVVVPSTGCPAGAMFNYITGAPCGAPAGLPAGCSSTAGYSPTTGARCDSGSTTLPTTTHPGAEGSFTVKQSAQPANNTNITSTTNVPVYGIELKATGSNIVIDRADLEVAVTVNGSIINPSGFVRRISAWDGSTLLKTMNLSSSDFTKDNSNLYYIRLTGIGFNIPKDATKTLTFSFDTDPISSADYTRVMTVKGYSGSTQNVRGVDEAGLNSYANANWTSSFTFQASNNATLTASADSAQTPKAQTLNVNTTDGLRGVTMMVFDLKSTIGDSNLTNVRVKVNTDSVATSKPTSLYLYDGSTLLGSAAVGTIVAGTTAVDFTNLDVPISKDAIKALKVTADFPSTAVGVASTSIATTDANTQFETTDGTTKNVTNASTIIGNDVHLLAVDAPQWTLVSANETATAGVASVASSSLTGTIILNVKALGGTLTKPTAGQFTVVFASSTQLTTNGGTNGVSYTAANSVPVTPSVTVTPNDSTVGDGNSYTVTITGTIYSSNVLLGTSQPLFMAIQDIDSTMSPSSGSITNMNWGIDTFYTNTQQLTKGTL